MVKTMFSIESDLERVANVYKECFDLLEVDMYELAATWYDKCLSADLRASLHEWRPQARVVRISWR